MATSQAKQALRDERKKKGDCLHCGEPAILNEATGKPETQCEKCKKKNKDNRAKYVERDAKRGVCCNIGCSKKTTDGKRYCDDCNAKSTARSSKTWHKRVAEKLCGDCGQRPPKSGITRCEDCQIRLAEGVKAMQNKRIADGRCGRCGLYVLVPGYKTCQVCIDKRRQWQADLKKQVMEAYGGPCCVGCGETEVAVLQIDHIDGGGHAHALKIGKGDCARGRGKMYAHLRDTGFPPGYRVLCANCNIKAARGIPIPILTGKAVNAALRGHNRAISIVKQPQEHWRSLLFAIKDPDERVAAMDYAMRMFKFAGLPEFSAGPRHTP